MTELRFESMKLPSANFGGQSSIPPLFPISRDKWERVYDLGENDGLFTDYGWTENILPYRHQDLFDRSLIKKDFKTAVLENDYLKAVFMPELGGRLWSLFDKKQNKNLIYENDCFRPGNLALRNAWSSGGVEWNLGQVGHTPLTCEQIFTARLTAKDGTPILRFYAFERVREVTYQMDFSLPEDSKALICRFRIKNLSDVTIPMYWWSNIAAEEHEDWRVIVPANDEYTNGPNNKETIPVRRDGVDISFPTHIETSRDGFFKIPENKHKYITYFSPDGSGFFQSSTSRLKGRKLFVWGQGPGADTWQNWLTDKAGRYIELQAGLGQTQYEHIPMPPRAAWEWVEAYGGVIADSNKIFGSDWEEANKEAENSIENVVKFDALEKYLVDSKADYALRPADEVIYCGSGWGALEMLHRKNRGQQELETHLDFGDVTDEQSAWTCLLQNGYCPCPSTDEIPVSYMVSKDWKKRLLKAVSGADAQNWYTHYLLGTLYVYEADYESALSMYRKSSALSESCWAYYGQAISYYFLHEDASAADMIQRALNLRKNDISLARDYCKMMNELRKFEDIIKSYKELDSEVANDPKIKFFYANSLCQCGQIKEAEEIIYSDGGLEIPDMREGETSLTNLWFDIEKKKAEAEGRKFDEQHAKPPAFLDFRMTVAKE